MRIKLHIILVLSLWSSMALLAQTIEHKDLVHISLSGSTNINAFKFYNKIEDTPDSRHVLTEELYSSDSLVKRLNLVTRNFKCDNKAMIPDFLKLLKSNQYPYIVVTVLQKRDCANEESDNKIISMKLSLAGVQKKYNVDCNIVKTQNNKIYLTGEQAILLSDFNLSPPSKFLGLIRVNEKVIVNFAIKLEKPQNCYNEIQHKNPLWSQGNDGNCKGR